MAGTSGVEAKISPIVAQRLVSVQHWDAATAFLFPIPPRIANGSAELAEIPASSRIPRSIYLPWLSTMKLTRDRRMFDEMERLREVRGLHRLLTHYADLAAPDWHAWQDRLLVLEGADPRDLVRWHGELLAYGWVEQNTGVIPSLKAGEAPGCYRITPAGLRALKQFRTEEVHAVP
jgi:hypothetical protein